MKIRKWVGSVLLKWLLRIWQRKNPQVDDSIPWIAAEDCRQGDILYADLEDDRLYRRGPGPARFALYTARRDIRAGEMVYDDLMAPGRSDIEFRRRND
jgi:hypothetical protein